MLMSLSGSLLTVESCVRNLGGKNALFPPFKHSCDSEEQTEREYGSTQAVVVQNMCFW